MAQKTLGVSDLNQPVGSRGSPVAGHLTGWQVSQLCLAAKRPDPQGEFKGTDLGHKSVRDFKEHVGPALLMADVTVEHVSTFKDTQLARGLGRSTANVLLKIVRMPFHKALAAGVISVNPTVPVHVKRIFPHQRNCFSVIQVRALPEAADDEMKTAIYLGLFTGLRLGDVIGIQRSDPSEDLSCLCLSPEKRRDGARAPLVVPFHSELKSHLASCCSGLQPGDFLMPKLHLIDIGGRNGVSRRFHELMERARIFNPAVKEKSREGRSFYALSCHSLRHTFNSWLANAGVRKETRMKLLDHRSEQVNDGYTYVQLETLKEAVGQLPQLAG